MSRCKIFFYPLSVFLLLFGELHAQVHMHSVENTAFVIHGGAGNFAEIPPERAEHYQESLLNAARKGYTAYKEGQAAEEIVRAVISELELDSLFNAGRGAVLDKQGKVSMDASIMRGRDLAAGGASGLNQSTHPIQVAKTVMEKSPHVLLHGAGAEQFARQQGMEAKDPSWFITSRIRKIYQRRMEEKKAESESSKGTVGCVALDDERDLAAGTSTGGMMLKSFGRIGDSPLIGAGAYASNGSCAISCTGHGELFIRQAAAYQVHARMVFAEVDLAMAMRETLESIETLEPASGGMIGLDRQGKGVLASLSSGMFAVLVSKQGKVQIQLYAGKLAYEGQL